MKLFNKIFSAVLILSLLLALVGCSDDKINLDSIPDYSGEPYVVINGGEPFFKSEEITDKAYESYSPLDALGRCGVAVACLGKEIMPTEEREDIASVTPSGWKYNDYSNNREYDFGYVYNRCHLIGFQLAGENANEKNLITGTRYMNIEGMLPFENMVADYIKETENHVMYRVTPIFDGYNYVASGVLMEAYSVEDRGAGIKFCIYAYNVQPGIEIDYFTGQNRKVGGSYEPVPSTPEGEVKYVLNTNSKKFHLPNKSCSNNIKEENRAETSKTKEVLLFEGYSACGTCKP